MPAARFMPAVIQFLGYNPLPAPRSIAQRVAYERTARGWSRKRLASLASVDEATVQRIETGARRLARRSVSAILAALEINWCENSGGLR